MSAGALTAEPTLDPGPVLAVQRAPWRERVVELLAVGAGSVLLFPLSWALRAALGLDEAEYAVGFAMFAVAHFVNDPHFAVTYLLFYRDAGGVLADRSETRGRRLRYFAAGVVTPTLLVGWAVVSLALGAAPLLGWMIQLMFLLVGWHYAKQGFGVLTVLSARRGVHFSHAERRAILGHCYAAWAFAWLNPAHAAGHFEEKGVLYWGPAVPEWLDRLGFVGFALSAAVVVLVLARKLARERSLPWLPLTAFVATIWLWTVFTKLDPLVRYAIPALHSLQYLYFVALLRGNEARELEESPTFGPPPRTALTALAVGALLLGYALFRGAPALFDGALVEWLASRSNAVDFGVTPVFAVLFVIVNVHHYVMDAVLWRRDNPRMRYLHAS